MENDHFFAIQTEQSHAKAKIVTEYFKAWSKIMTKKVEERSWIADKKIGYIDLFSGQGRYDDGKASTPLLILEYAISTPKLRSMLTTTFNDVDNDNAVKLRLEIDSLTDIDKLTHYPIVYNREVDDNIISLLDQTKFIPSLIFIDPWGYKGVSLALIRAAIKHWGCDAILFFNYNRVNMGISNPLVEERMKALFGEEKSIELRQKVELLSRSAREKVIIDEFVAVLKDSGLHVLPFPFKNNQGTRTTHHLLFISKDTLGYKIMKDIMAKRSSTSEQGVASFTFNPAEAHVQAQQLSWLAEPGPLDRLKESLLQTFAGRSLTVDQAFQLHHVGTNYVEKNYRDAFRDLETSGLISASIPVELRKKRAGQVVIKDVVFSFPPLHS